MKGDKVSESERWRYDVSFFCPAYFDEGNIEGVVQKALDVLSSQARRFEIIIVNDGSPDGTGEVAEHLASEHQNVRVIHHPQNRGYGEALKTGLGAASYEVVAFADGDDQYDPRDLARMLPLLQEHDAVIGYRLNLPNSCLRNLLSKLYNMAMRWLFDVPYRDLSCSLKVFKKKAVDRIPIRGSGIFTQAEIVLRFHRAGFRVAQVGIPAHPRLHGRSSSITWRNFLILVKEALLLWRELYLS